MESGIGAGRTRLLLAALVFVTGLVLLVPNTLPWLFWWQADRSAMVVATWDGSKVTSSDKDTVEVPSYRFSRRIGPLVQDCRVAFVRYRHKVGGKPVFATLDLVVGDTCNDVIVLNDPPRERIALIVLGLIVIGFGVFMGLRARASGAAA